MCTHPLPDAVNSDGRPLVCGMTFTCKATPKFFGYDPAARGVAFSNNSATTHRNTYHLERTKRKEDADNTKLLAIAASGLPTAAEAEINGVAKAQRDEVQEVMAKFVADSIAAAAMSRGSNQKASCCRWLVFSRQELTNNTFRCEDFRQVCTSGDANYAKFNPDDVADWVPKAFHLLMLMAGYVTIQKEKLHGGDECFQFMHDGVTVSHKKFQSFGMQTEWEGINWLLNIGFTHMTGGLAQDISDGMDDCLARMDEIRDQLKAYYHSGDYKMKDLMCGMVSDFAALAVSRLQEQDIEGCMMHSANKPMQYGMSVPKIGGVASNPYPAAYALLRKIEKAASYYTYDKRAEGLEASCKVAKITPITPNQDLNGTRVASFNGLNLSMCRLEKGLFIDWALRPKNNHKLDEDDFKTMRELEAISRITAEETTRTQNESKMNRAYRPVINHYTEAQLASDSFAVIDGPNVGFHTEKDLPRVEKPRGDFTEIGKTVLERTTEKSISQHLHPAARINDTDLIATLLDLRTKNAPHLTDEQVQEARKLLRIQHVKSATQADMYVWDLQNTGMVATPAPVPVAPTNVPAIHAAEFGEPVRKKPRTAMLMGANRFAAPANAHNNTIASSVSDREGYRQSRLTHHKAEISTF